MDLDITDFSRKWRFSCEETFFTANSYIFREMCVFVNKKINLLKIKDLHTHLSKGSRTPMIVFNLIYDFQTFLTNRMIIFFTSLVGNLPEIEEFVYFLSAMKFHSF